MPASESPSEPGSVAASADLLHLAVALDGAGWHPAAWREPRAAAGAELFAAPHWVDTVREAERGLLDLVTFEDSVGLQSDDPAGPDRRTDRVRGRLDALLLAARVAPATTHIGLVPTVVVTHTEPFHVSKAIATLDHVSLGRAGLRVQISSRAADAALFGRRAMPAGPADPAVMADLFDEAADAVEVLRRLWDSWEDDAEIRDVATGRFLDRDKLHYIDFRGAHFSVKGPSITPRPPQGQPLVTALAHVPAAYRLAARSADVVFVTPRDAAHARSIVAEVRAAQAAAGRDGETLHVFGDVAVFLAADEAAARARRARLDEVAGGPFASDAAVFVGTPAGLADLLQDWASAGLTGFRLRPGAIPDDLEAITRGLVPELQRRGVFRTAYEASTLRGLLGLARPADRYAAA